MKKPICQNVIFFIGFLISVETLSYVPSSDFILKEVIKNHGKGHYLIEQELMFPIEKTQKVIKETWYVTFTQKNKNDQRLQLYLMAKADNLHIERLYVNGVVYQKDNGKSLQRQKWPLEFIEPWFITRSLKQLQSAILRHQMAGTAALNWNPNLFITPSQNKQLLSSISIPISLSRSQGRIMYTYQKNKDGSGLWIEQDNFVIRKLKLKTGVQILARGYNDYSQSLKFPRHRLLINEDISIPIRVLKVTSLSSKDRQQRTSVQSFHRSQTNITRWGESDMLSIIKDFYSRFR